MLTKAWLGCLLTACSLVESENRADMVAGAAARMSR
jgi:hypothetical protein